jgi:hypothetical protein
MYGTIARMRPMAGKLPELEAFIDAWNRERKPAVPGAISSYILIPDDNPAEVLAVAIFADKESYVANADDPEQDRWYRRMRDLLVGDPIWQDGRIAGE